MKIDIEQLPTWVKLEVSKEDLLAFAEKLRVATEIKASPQSKPPDELLNFNQMCAFLGIAKSTGYQRISRGEIPHFKKGRRLYSWKSELIKYVESGRRKTKLDLEEVAGRYLNRSRSRGG